MQARIVIRGVLVFASAICVAAFLYVLESRNALRSALIRRELEGVESQLRLLSVTSKDLPSSVKRRVAEQVTLAVYFTSCVAKDQQASLELVRIVEGSELGDDAELMSDLWAFTQREYGVVYELKYWLGKLDIYL